MENLRILVRIETRRILVSEGVREKTRTRYYINDEDFPLAKYYGALDKGL